jgi:hypothetical protein
MAGTGNPTLVCVHAGIGRAGLIGMMLFSAATFFAFQDVIDYQMNARRITTIVYGMQATVVDLVDFTFGNAERLFAHFEQDAIVGNDRYMHAVRMR